MITVPRQVNKSDMEREEAEEETRGDPGLIALGRFQHVDRILVRIFFHDNTDCSMVTDDGRRDRDAVLA